MLKIENPAQVEMLVPITFGLLDPTAEPTLETETGTTIVGDSIAAGGVAGNAMDGYANHPLTVTTDTGAVQWRIDLAMQHLAALDALVLDHINFLDVYPAALRSLVLPYHDTDAAFAGATQITPSTIYSGLLGKRRPFIRLNGVGDYLTHAADDVFDWSNIKAVEVIIRVPTSEKAFHLCGCCGTYANSAKGWAIAKPSSAGALILRLMDPGQGSFADLTIAAEGTINDDEWHRIMVIVEDDGTITPHFDGTAGTASADLSDYDCDNALGFYAGRRNGDAYAMLGDIALIRIWNYGPDSDEMSDLYEGWSHTPIPAAYQYGDETNLVTDPGIESWTGDNPDSYKDYGTPTITDEAGTVHGGSHSCKIVAPGTYDGIEPNSTISTTVGKKYRASVWLYGDGSVKIAARMYNASGWFWLNDDDSDNGTVVPAAWTKFEVEFTAAYSSYDFEIFTGSGETGGGTYYIDDLELIEIGCTVEYNHDGMSLEQSKWLDASGNDLHLSEGGAPEYIDAPEGGVPGFLIYKFTEVTKRYLFIDVNALGETADGDAKIGLAAWCKSMTLNLSAANGQMGYGGVILKSTDEGNTLAEKLHDRRPSWILTPETYSEDDWETLQNLLDKIEGNLYPVWICTNPSADEPIWWRCRIVRDPTWTRSTAGDPWSAPLQLIAENN